MLDKLLFQVVLDLFPLSANLLVDLSLQLLIARSAVTLSSFTLWFLTYIFGFLVSGTRIFRVLLFNHLALILLYFLNRLRLVFNLTCFDNF